MSRAPYRVRGIVVAGAAGRRLEPLTSFVPPLLLPITGGPAIRFTLRALERAGVERATLVLGPEGERVERVLGDHFGELPLDYSHRETAVGSFEAFKELPDGAAAADALVVVDATALCRWPLKRMLRRHRKREADATLLLSKRARPAEESGVVTVGQKGQILALRDADLDLEAGEKTRRLVFAGAQVLSPRLVAQGGPRGDLMRDLYEPLMIGGGRLQTVTTGRHWHRVTSIRRYREAAWDWAHGRWPLRAFRSRWIASEARLGNRVRIRQSVLEGGVEVGDRARIDRSSVLPGARIGAGSRVEGSIIAPGVELPESTRVSGRLVTPLTAGRDPGANDSVVGKLVYTPIGKR